MGKTEDPLFVSYNICLFKLLKSFEVWKISYKYPDFWHLKKSDLQTGLMFPHIDSVLEQETTV